MDFVSTRKQVIDNVIRFNGYANSKRPSERQFFIEHAHQGSNYVCLRTGGLILLAPSRFVGYADNTAIRHVSNTARHGTKTTGEIDSILGPHGPTDDGEKCYNDMCHEHNLKPTARARSYWHLEAAADPGEDEVDFTHFDPSDFPLDPVAREVVVKRIERGEAGEWVKMMNGHKCQLCDALGLEQRLFATKAGNTYVEAHHAIPVSERQAGTLHASFIMSLCANHHRQMHHDPTVRVAIQGYDQTRRNEALFKVSIDGRKVKLKRQPSVMQNMEEQ
jgi:hypothetical protein